MTRAPAAAAKNIKTAAAKINKTKFKINYLRRDVNLVLIEEYKPEISALKQKLEEMRGSL